MLLLLTNMAREELIAQLNDGLILMFLGMGTVFIFLAILIFTTKGLSAVCKKFEVTKNVPTTVEKKVAAVSGNKDNEIAAAIAIAYSKSKTN